MPTKSFDVAAFMMIDGGEKWGALTVIDSHAKSRILWLQRTEDPLIGGVLAAVDGLALTVDGKNPGLDQEARV